MLRALSASLAVSSFCSRNTGFRRWIFSRRKWAAKVEPEATTPTHNEDDIASAVRIFVTQRRLNPYLPWRTSDTTETSGSGLLLPNRQILTNAHVIANHTSVSVQMRSTGALLKANVLAASHECDLALLSVDDDALWKNAPSIRFSGVPQLYSPIRVVGFPIEEKDVVTTSGIVSDIEVQQYSHCASFLLMIRSDAKIRPGNSGGPVFQNGQVVGLAFQSNLSDQGSNFIIPTPVIHRFLTEYSRFGHIQGVPALGLFCQAMENQYIRQRYRLSNLHEGVLVNKVQNTSSARGILQEGDVILSIDNVSVNNCGLVPFGEKSVIMDHLISMKYVGDEIKFRILRDGEEMDKTVLAKVVKPLVPIHQYDKDSGKYFVFGGYVFVPLSQPYLHEFGANWLESAPRKLVSLALDGLLEEDGQEVVVISHIFMDSSSRGYSRDVIHSIVKTVNKQRVRNLKTLVILIQQISKGFIEIGLDDGRVIVLDSVSANMSTRLLLRKQNIPPALDSMGFAHQSINT